MAVPISADTRVRAAFWLLLLSRPLLVAYRARAEILLTIAMLGGWFLVTLGIVQFTTPKVWPLSAGVLLLSCCGWRMLWTVASYGLYGLTRTNNRDG